MYLRPQSLASIAEPEELGESAVPPQQAKPEGDAIAALLDGVPVANHQRLVDRLILDDPDDYSARTPAAKRSHGTSMASLIVHGDLQAGEQPVGRPLYVRPIMVYDAAADAETTPPDRLPLDVSCFPLFFCCVLSCCVFRSLFLVCCCLSVVFLI